MWGGGSLGYLPQELLMSSVMYPQVGDPRISQFQGSRGSQDLSGSSSMCHLVGLMLNGSAENAKGWWSMADVF